MCTVPLPPGVNPIAVDKYIVSILQKILSGWNKEYHGPVISTPSTYSEDPVFKLEGRHFVLRLFVVFSSLFRQMSGWCNHLVTVSSCHTISSLLFLLLLDTTQFDMPKSSLNDRSGLNRVASIQVDGTGCLSQYGYYATKLKTMLDSQCVPPPPTDFIKFLKPIEPPTQYVPANFPPELRRSYREPGHSPPSRAEGNDADAKRVCVSVLTHVLLVSYLTKQPKQQRKLFPTSKKKPSGKFSSGNG
jgi:hypothetical protein